MKRFVVSLLAAVFLICNIGFVTLAESTFLDVTVDTGMIGNIFFDSEMASFKITYFNDDEISQGVNVEYKFYKIGTDMGRAECISTYTADYTIDAKSEYTAEISTPISEYGLYELEMVLKNSRGEVATRTVPFSNAVRNTEVSSTVGTNVHLIWFGDADNTLHLVRNAGMGTIRDGMPWNYYEGKKGVYKFTERTKKMLQAAEKYDLDVLGVISSDTNIYDDGALKSDFLRESEVDEYKNFLNAFLNEELVKNNVTKLEMMNEPMHLYHVVDGVDVREFDSDTAQAKRAEAYVRMVKATREVVDTISEKDYKIGVLSLTGLTVNGYKKFADFVYSKLSAGDFDAISLHPYVDVGEVPEYHPSKGSVRQQADYYKNLANGAVQGSHTGNTYSLNVTEPMWHTEFGYSSAINTGLGSEYEQAKLIIRALDELKRDNPDDIAYIYQMSSAGTNIENSESNYELVRSYSSENPYSAKFAYLAVCNYNSLTANATRISRVETGDEQTGGNYITKYEKDGQDVYLVRTTKGTGSTTYDFGSENLYYYDIFGNKLDEADVKFGYGYSLKTTPYYIVSGTDVKRAEPEYDTKMRSGDFVIRGRIPSGAENKKISLTVTDYDSVFGSENIENNTFFMDQGMTGENGAFEFNIKVYDKDHIKAYIVTEDDEMIVLEFGISIDESGSISVTSGGVNVDNLAFGRVNLSDLTVSLDLGDDYTSYKMICALYKDNRLVNLRLFDQNLVVGNTSVTQKVSFNEAAADCDRLQIMIVKDLDTIIPLCEAYTKN